MTVSSRPQLIASPWHTLILVILLLSPAVWYFFHPLASAPTSTTVPSTRHSPLPFYALSVGSNLALAYFAWVGVHKRNLTLATLTGPGLLSRTGLIADLALTALYFLIWEAAAFSFSQLIYLPSRSDAPDSTAAAIRDLLPTGPIEIAAWFAVSLTAGICEELIFRGYLQKQFHALTKNLPTAILLQAALFAIVHSYKGPRQMLLIFPLALLYGLFALTRNSLRPNMLTHTLTDIFEGWMKFL